MSPVVVSAGAYNNDEDRGGGGPRWWDRLRVLLRPELLSLIVCCVLAVLVFKTAWTAPGTKMISGGGGDAGLLLWFLRWTPFAVARGMNPLFTDYINVPDGVNVM